MRLRLVKNRVVAARGRRACWLLKKISFQSASRGKGGCGVVVVRARRIIHFI